MAPEAYEDWLARGRQHLWQGRPTDAMLCFRRAVRINAREADARFHLGEALWQLGLAGEAITAWREASAAEAGWLAPRLALAEASLTQRDFVSARGAADAALALEPGNARARAIVALARIALRDAGASFDHLRTALIAQPGLLEVPELCEALALVLDGESDASGHDALFATIAPHAERLPLALCARTAEGMLASAKGVEAFVNAREIVAVASQRTAASDDIDALRRLALVAWRCNDAHTATIFAERHAAVCHAKFAPPVPLLWPRRTAGARLRMLVLLHEDSLPPADAMLTARMPRGLDAVELFVLAAGDVDATKSKFATALPASAQWAALPPEPDSAFARALATRDCDVLIDAAGLTCNAGPLLAMRPAREIWTLDELAAPHAAPLVDQVLAPDAIATVTANRSAELSSDRDGVTTADLTARFDAAVRAHQRGDLAEAREGYAWLLERQPGFAPALHLAGTLARDAGDADEAQRRYRDALVAAPAFVDARLASIHLALAVSDVHTARRDALEGLERAPMQARLWRALGQVELKSRAGAGAAAAFERALALEPADGETHYNHGVALQMQGLPGDAARAYQRALAFRPDYIAADFNLGVIFQQEGNAAAAAAAYSSVIARVPAHVAAHKNLGETLLAAGRFEAFVEQFRHFERCCPDALPLAVQALEACQYAADFAGIERYLDGLRRERFHAASETELVDALEQLLYLLLFFDVEPEMIFRFAQTYDLAARRVYGEPVPRPMQRHPGKVRIGYLSGDLRNHVMGKMMWQAIERHDRSRFELYFYALSDARDEWTARFESIATRFEQVAPLADDAAVERIAADDLDVLVDLATHTRGAKPGILARKPARVQVTHVASAGCLGLSAVDFKLTDRHADVPEAQAFQRERMLAMEGCVYPFRHVEAAEVPEFARPALGIADDAFVVGAFVNPLKLSRRCLLLWRDALGAIPAARIAFSPANPALRSVYERLARAAGIERERLVFMPQGRDDAENQARYRVVDIVLDPLPFGGVNGTIEALDMGVPVVTLMGRRHGERTSYSILASLGVTQTVASTGREYVDIAVRLATDPGFARDVRAAIRAGLSASPLTDMDAHARNLEAAYLAALNAVAPDALAAASS